MEPFGTLGSQYANYISHLGKFSHFDVFHKSEKKNSQGLYLLKNS